MNSQMRWDPFTDLQNTMDRLFDQGFSRPWRLMERESNHSSFPVNIWETENEVHLQAALPGVRPEDVNIATAGEVVTIKAEPQSDGSSESTYHLSEIPSGPFSRSFTLSVPIDADKAEARYEHGMLYLTLPKAEYLRPRQIKVSGTNDHPLIS